MKKALILLGCTILTALWLIGTLVILFNLQKAV